MDTLAAKVAFEKYTNSHGVLILHYHSDKGRFSERLYLDYAAKKGQTVSFCGVNAHFQNGMAKKRVWDCQDRSQTTTVHANNIWPSAINSHLWSYVLRLINKVHKTAPCIKDGHSPLEIFFGVPVKPIIKDVQPFGCPYMCLTPTWQVERLGQNWVNKQGADLFWAKSQTRQKCDTSTVTGDCYG